MSSKNKAVASNDNLVHKRQRTGSVHPSSSSHAASGPLVFPAGDMGIFVVQSDGDMTWYGNTMDDNRIRSEEYGNVKDDPLVKVVVEDGVGFILLYQSGKFDVWTQNVYNDMDDMRGTHDIQRFCVRAKDVYTFRSAFVVVLHNNMVIPFGVRQWDAHDLSAWDRFDGRTIESFCSIRYDFAAKLGDGSLVTGGDSSSVQEELTLKLKSGIGVDSVYSTGSAFVAKLANGSVVAWGDSQYGGDVSPLVKSQLTLEENGGVNMVYSNEYAFVAKMNNGLLVTWGCPKSGGDSSSVKYQLQKGVRTVYSTKRAFAAVLQDDSLVTWGSEKYGGYSVSVSKKLKNKKVASVHANDNAFAVKFTDDSAVVLGDIWRNEDTLAVMDQLSGGKHGSVDTIHITNCGYAFTMKDGSVVTWGASIKEKERKMVMAKTKRHRVKTIYTGEHAFSAILADGSVITWGQEIEHQKIPEHVHRHTTAIYPFEDRFLAVLDDDSVAVW